MKLGTVVSGLFVFRCIFSSGGVVTWSIGMLSIDRPVWFV